MHDHLRSHHPSRAGCRGNCLTCHFRRWGLKARQRPILANLLISPHGNQGALWISPLKPVAFKSLRPIRRHQPSTPTASSTLASARTGEGQFHAFLKRTPEAVCRSSAPLGVTVKTGSAPPTAFSDSDPAGCPVICGGVIAQKPPIRSGLAGPQAPNEADIVR